MVLPPPLPPPSHHKPCTAHHCPWYCLQGAVQRGAHEPGGAGRRGAGHAAAGGFAWRTGRRRSPHLPALLPACLPAHLPACLPAYLILPTSGAPQHPSLCPPVGGGTIRRCARRARPAAAVWRRRHPLRGQPPLRAARCARRAPPDRHLHPALPHRQIQVQCADATSGSLHAQCPVHAPPALPRATAVAARHHPRPSLHALLLLPIPAGRRQRSASATWWGAHSTPLHPLCLHIRVHPRFSLHPLLLRVPQEEGRGVHQPPGGPLLCLSSDPPSRFKCNPLRPVLFISFVFITGRRQKCT